MWLFSVFLTKYFDLSRGASQYILPGTHWLACLLLNTWAFTWENAVYTAQYDDDQGKISPVKKPLASKACQAAWEKAVHVIPTQDNTPPIICIWPAPIRLHINIAGKPWKKSEISSLEWVKEELNVDLTPSHWYYQHLSIIYWELSPPFVMRWQLVIRTFCDILLQQGVLPWWLVSAWSTMYHVMKNVWQFQKTGTAIPFHSWH